LYEQKDERPSDGKLLHFFHQKFC